LNTYHVVLYLHVLSLLVGFSAGMIVTVCLVRLRAAQTFEAAAPWGKLAGEVEKAFPVAVVGLFATGAYMTSDVWTWDTPWVVTSIVGLAILALQGPLVAGRRGAAVERALLANGPGPLGAAARRLARDPALWAADLANEALVLAIIWNMTQKPGWGGAIAALAVAYAIGILLGLLLSRPAAADASVATPAT